MAASINVINNGVYRGTPTVSSSSVPKVAANDIKSGQGLGTTMWSWLHASPRYTLTNDASGNTKYRVVTANNIFESYDVGINGYFSQMDDGPIRNGVQLRPIAYWIANGNDNPPVKNNVIPRISDLTNGKTDSFWHVEGITPLGMWMPNKHDTNPNMYTTQDLITAYDMNARGKLASHTEKFRQKIKTGVLHDGANQLHYEISRWYEFLDSKGIHPNEQPVHAIGVGNIGGLASYSDSLKSLSANLNFHDMAKAWIEGYGLKGSEAVQAMERSIILHEISHAFGVDGNRRGEQLQGRLQAEFYSMLAKEFEGSKWQRIYSTLSEVGKDYAEKYSFFNYLKWQASHEEARRQTAQTNVLLRKYMIEGEKSGLEGEALGKYVESRLKDTFRGFREEDGETIDSAVQNAFAEMKSSAQSAKRSSKSAVYAKASQDTEYQSNSEKTYSGKVVSISEYRGGRARVSSRQDAKSKQSEKEAAKEQAQEAQAKEAQGEAPEAEAQEGPAAEAA